MRSISMWIIVLLMAVAIGCSSGKSNTSIPGSWSIVTTESEGSNNTLQVSLVSSACSVSTPVGTFTVQGPSCFIADDNTGQGTISGTGNFFYPPQGLLAGVPYNPTPSNGSATVDLLFVEADQFGDIAVANGIGTVTNGTIAGTWTCNPDTPICTGLSGTFSGTKQ